MVKGPGVYKDFTVIKLHTFYSLYLFCIVKKVINKK